MFEGISATGRGELAQVLGARPRVLTVETATSALGVSARDAAKKLARWAEAGWLKRVRRGLYIPVPVDAAPDSWSEDPLVLADAVWSSCYFTGWTAANHWGLTEQTFRTVLLKTTTRVRAGKQRLLDFEFLVSHIPSNQLWGTVPVWRQDVRIEMADATRTMLDILDAPALGGGIRHAADILGNYLEQHDAAKLVAYADRLENRTVFKRLGYLIGALGLDRPDLIGECRKRLSSGTSLLDPDAPAEGPRATEWSLRANVHIEKRDAS